MGSLEDQKLPGMSLTTSAEHEMSLALCNVPGQGELAIAGDLIRKWLQWQGRCLLVFVDSDQSVGGRERCGRLEAAGENGQKPAKSNLSNGYFWSSKSRS